MGVDTELATLWRKVQDLERQLGMLAEAPRVRTRLTANLTLYVRADGSNTNDGLANTASRAFLTIQYAVDRACYDYDCGSYTLTIQIATGNWAAPITLRDHPGITALALRGDPTTPANAIIQATGPATLVTVLGKWDLDGLTLQRQTSGDVTAIIGYTPRCVCQLSNVHFGVVGAAGRHMQTEEGAKLYIRTNYTVTTGGIGFGYHMVASWAGSVIHAANRVANFVGAGAIAGYFSFCANQATLYAFGMSFTGNAATLTGTRYAADRLGHIETAGGGANFFPGNVAGAPPTNGGIYT